MNSSQSEAHSDDIESLVRARTVELTRTIESLQAEVHQLHQKNQELARSLADASLASVAIRDARRAALNLMEDAVSARRAEQRENIQRGKVEAELREASRRKDEFLATLAHELRNPLAPIRNSLEIIRLAGHDSETVGMVFEMMERQVNHMVRLVNDLMEVSRITRGQIDLRKDEVSLATVVRTAVELSKPLIDAAGHQLAISLPVDQVILHVDPTRISQVISNLLNNSAKYTSEGGQIWLSARADDSSVVISVRDSGAGIPQEMLSKVFDLFTQVDRTLGRAQGGLGIGLSLVRSLVEAHGGRVEARSDGIDCGSEFLVRLPLANAPLLTSKPIRRIDHPLALAPRPILIVDDNIDAAKSMEMLLKLLGIEARTVNTGAAALELLKTFRPPIVFLDISMPEMDGHEVARRIRRRPELANVALVALTGWGQDEDRRRCREAGFDHHLIKPIELSALEELLVTIPVSNFPCVN